MCMVHSAGLRVCIVYVSVFNCNRKSAHLTLFIWLFRCEAIEIEEKRMFYILTKSVKTADVNCFSYLWFGHNNNNVLCSSVSDDIVSLRNFICFEIFIPQMSRMLIQNRKDKNVCSLIYLLHEAL